MTRDEAVTRLTAIIDELATAYTSYHQGERTIIEEEDEMLPHALAEESSMAAVERRLKSATAGYRQAREDDVRDIRTLESERDVLMALLAYL